MMNDWIAHEPDMAWDAMVRVVAEVPSDGLGFIGAGPLEDLLRHHAVAFIDRVEQQAAADDRFRIALRDVWRDGMSDDIWQRVTVAHGKE